MSILIRDRPAGRHGGKSTCRETEGDRSRDRPLWLGQHSPRDWKLKTWDRAHYGLALSRMRRRDNAGPWRKGKTQVKWNQEQEGMGGVRVIQWCQQLVALNMWGPTLPHVLPDILPRPHCPTWYVGERSAGRGHKAVGARFGLRPPHRRDCTLPGCTHVQKGDDEGRYDSASVRWPGLRGIQWGRSTTNWKFIHQLPEASEKLRGDFVFGQVL